MTQRNCLVFSFADTEVRESEFCIVRNGDVLPVEPKAFRVLLVLLRNPRKLVTKEELLDAVWGDIAVSENSLTRSIALLRKLLGDDTHEPHYIATVPTVGYRFLCEVQVSADGSGPEPVSGEAAKPPGQPTPPTAAGEKLRQSPKRGLLIVAACFLCTLLTAGGVAYKKGHAPAQSPTVEHALAWLHYLIFHTAPLSAKDTIVLADFANSTGDPVFDDALRQGMVVQLEQSPYLTLISDRRIHTTLQLMGQASGARITPQIASEICERTSSAAVLDGSIAKLGSQYVLGLQAKLCATGQILDEEQVEAARKEDVLKALDGASATLRGKLGESLNSVRKYDTPLEEASTSSLEALKAYSQGRRIMLARGYIAALPFYQRAVELDPNFAIAYRNLSASYLSLNEDGRAVEMARKAYELRGRVSERERFSIEGNYYLLASGNLEKATQVFESWRQIYPRGYVPYLYLGHIASCLGDSDKELQNRLEALRLEPGSAGVYALVGASFAKLDRLDEAAAVFRKAEEQGLEGEILRSQYYLVAFIRGDSALQQRLVAEATGKLGTEEAMLATQANAEAWFGRMAHARELTDRAMSSAVQRDAQESAAAYEAEEALNEAEVGCVEQARAHAKAALRLSSNHDVKDVAMLALAEARDSRAAERMAMEVSKTYPEDTLIQSYWVPTVQAAVELDKGNSARAIELLQLMGVRELSQPTPFAILMHPVYLRGQAFLAARKGKEAAAEFQKILDHHGLMQNDPIGALAHLQLGRAYAMFGKLPEARGAYEDFLNLWKDADAALPALEQAKAEYTKLK